MAYLNIGPDEVNNISNLTLDDSLMSSLPVRLIEKHHILPLAIEDGVLIIGTDQPHNIELKDLIEQEVQGPCHLVRVDIFELQHALISHFGRFEEVFESVSDFKGGVEKEAEASFLVRELDPVSLILVKGQPSWVQIVDMLFYYAITHRASDIHIEPGKDKLNIRLRIDGVLHLFQSLPSSAAVVIGNIIKIDAGMDIAESRLPQDGQFIIQIRDRQVNLRVATIGAIYGEKITIRIHDSYQIYHHLSELGFSEYHESLLIQGSTRSSGLMLVTGPTGSGKTTTLYALLDKINDVSRQILTVEDPVEKRLDWINQVEVNAKINMDFARTCRSFLRQDPDVILVGEIRDQETVSVAVQNALVGALLLSTLHCNDAVRSIDRLCNLGLTRYIVSTVLNMVVSQRLARRVCNECSESYSPDPKLLKQIGLKKKSYKRGKGCKSCLGTGYYGRVALVEILEINTHLRSQIYEERSFLEIRNAAIDQGFVPMINDAREKVSKGLTTIEEVARVMEINE
ncbi:MAG: ATPase [Actinobacteria bacterium]|nr:ATPase [Actinomycetota bacterium]|tara:strand:+ start:282 stop:1820 length:1539 start_codon:yes stop_codon:yes gene_type:complete